MDYARIPLEPIVGSGNQTIAFDQLYPAYLIVDLMIFNKDASNTISYRINNLSAVTLPVSSIIAFQNIVIWKLEIIASAGVEWEVTPFGVPLSVVTK